MSMLLGDVREMSKAVTRANLWPEAKPALDANALYEAIVLLAAGCDSARHRERAARQVLDQVRQLARSSAVTRLLSKPGYRACGDDLIQDAIQHTAIVVCSSAEKFRGSNAAMAVAWCLGILRNYARSEVRRRAQLQRETFGRPAEQLARGAAADDMFWHAAAQEAHLTLRSLDAQVRSHLQQTRSQRAAESLYRAVCSYVFELAGSSDVGSLVESSEPAGARGDEGRRARARTYQHHHRARCILAEVRAAYDNTTDEPC